MHVAPVHSRDAVARAYEAAGKRVLITYIAGTAAVLCGRGALVVRGRIDLRPMLTHTFGRQQWREAFLAIANQGDSGAVRVVIDQR